MEYMKLFTSLCLPFEKEIQEIQEPILPPFTDPQYKNKKDLFIDADLLGQSSILTNTMAHEQETIHLDKSSTCLQGSQTIIAHCVDAQEALQDQGSDV